jgi:glycosyltransferase involved in cell wall biosynthesis
MITELTKDSNTVMNNTLIAICIPTFMRPLMLTNCLQHIAKLNLPNKYRLEVLVIDNDANGSASSIVDEQSTFFPMPIHCFIEPKRGLSHVRNRCIQETLTIGANLLAFIDDDEFPHPNWLNLHIAALSEHNADVARGNVIPIQQDELNKIDWLSLRPKKVRETGTPARRVNTGNVVFKPELANQHNIWFDPYFNFIGGEDQDFFQRLIDTSHAKAIWVADALVYELVPPERGESKYKLSRTYKGAVTNVIKYQYRSPSFFTTLIRFIPKIINKLISGLLLFIISLATGKQQREKAILQLTVAAGYLAGLLGQKKDVYKDVDGN